MKQLGILILKEFYHILRDRRTLLILFGLPVIQILLFGFAITNDIKNARIAILDPAHDEVSLEVRQRLLSSGYFLLESEAASMGEVLQAFRESRIKMAVIFPPEMQERFFRDENVQIQFIADAAEPNTATSLVHYARAIVQDYQMEKLGIGELPLQIHTEVKMLYNPNMKSVYMFVPGVMTVVLMLICALMTSIAITKEKELGTMEVLLVSPVRPIFLILGKVAPYFILGMLIAIVTLLLGVFVFHVPIRGSIGLLMGVTVLFVLTSLALGIFISTRTDSQMVAMLLSLLVLMMPGILLSGFIFPIESMPLVLQYLSHVIPAKWYLITIKSVMLKGVGLEYIWRETLILAGMFVFIIAIGVKNFKIRLA